MQPCYTERSSNDPLGVARAGVEPDGAVCSGFCTVDGASARAAVEVETLVVELGAWMAGENAERLLGAIMISTLARRD